MLQQKRVASVNSIITIGSYYPPLFFVVVRKVDVWYSRIVNSIILDIFTVFTYFGDVFSLPDRAFMSFLTLRGRFTQYKMNVKRVLSVIFSFLLIQYTLAFSSSGPNFSTHYVVVADNTKL